MTDAVRCAVYNGLLAYEALPLGEPDSSFFTRSDKESISTSNARSAAVWLHWRASTGEAH